MNPNELMLLTDFYEYTMSYAYFKENKHEEIGYFDMFVRKIPDGGGYLIANGLHRFIEFIQDFHFTDAQIDYLRSTGYFDEDFLTYLKNLKMDIDVWAVPEGTPVFANEPLVTIRGKLIQAQIVETILLVFINYSTLVTTKASRIVAASRGRAVLEFGSRRAHGIDAATEGARACYIAGARGTACTLAGQKYAVPVSGTVAHSYIQLHDSEYEAFLQYARVSPDNCVLLVDTYDTLHSGIPNAIRVAKEYLIPHGYRLKGIRIDSGDLAYLSKKARKMLDAEGLTDTQIVVSNSLDEFLIDDLIMQGARIDSFGVGENMITAKSTPVLGGVYKVCAHERDGVIIPKIKISGNVEKLTNPGFKKIVRFYDNDDGKAIGDVLALRDEVIDEHEYLLFDPQAPWKQKRIRNYTVRELQVPIFIGGQLVYDVPSTEQVKRYCQQQMDTLWDEVKRLRYPHRYYVDYSQTLYDLKQKLIEENTMKI